MQTSDYPLDCEDVCEFWNRIAFLVALVAHPCQDTNCKARSLAKLARYADAPPNSVLTDMPPPMRAHNFLLNARPSPVPPYFFDVARVAWPKYLNKCSISGRAIPIPESKT